MKDGWLALFVVTMWYSDFELWTLSQYFDYILCYDIVFSLEKFIANVFRLVLFDLNENPLTFGKTTFNPSIRELELNTLSARAENPLV